MGSLPVLPSEAPNWVYRYDARPGKWTQILSESEGRLNGQENHRSDGKTAAEQPLPRCAHQVVYDPTTKTVFMHGGNAGITGASGGVEKSGARNLGDDGDRDGGGGGEECGGVEGVEDESGKEGKERRLDDFWCMSLMR